MAVEIKSGNSSDLQTVDPVSKAGRVTMYNSDGVEGTKEMPVSITCAPIITEDDDLISSVDVTDYKSISLQLTGTWAGTVSFQGSNDNGTFYNIVAQDTTSTTAPFSASTSSIGLFSIPIVYKYFRARVTTFTSGTVTGTAYGHKEDSTLNSVGQIGEVTLAAETTKVIGTVNVSSSVSYVAGTITASDTSVVAPTHDGTFLTGTPSVNSYFAAPGSNALSTWVVEIAGTLGGATFYFEGSAGSTDGADGNWVSLTSLQRGLSDSPLSFNGTTEGEYTGNATGLSYFRVRAVGGVGVNVTVAVNFSRGAIAINFNAPLPAGTNVVGSVNNVATLAGVAPSMGGGVSDAGTQRVSLASDEPIALAAGATTIGSIDDLAKIGGVAVSMGAGVVDAGTQRVTLTSDEPIALAAGSSQIGHVIIDPNPTAMETDLFVGLAGAINVNSRSIKSTATTLRSIVFTNLAATPRYLKLYDTAGTPTAGAGTPVLLLSLASPGTLTFPLPSEGFVFANGIGMTMTLKPDHADVTSTATVDFSTVAVFHA